jgi:hypothetical protein
MTDRCAKEEEDGRKGKREVSNGSSRGRKGRAQRTSTQCISCRPPRDTERDGQHIDPLSSAPSSTSNKNERSRTYVEELLDAVLSFPTLSISDLLLTVLEVSLGRRTSSGVGALLSDSGVDLRLFQWARKGRVRRTSEGGSRGEGKEAAEGREDVRSGSAGLGETMPGSGYELDEYSWYRLLVEIPKASSSSERGRKGERTSSGSSSSSSSAAGASSSSFSSGASSVEATSVLSACALHRNIAKREEGQLELAGGQ